MGLELITSTALQRLDATCHKRIEFTEWMEAEIGVIHDAKTEH